MPAMDQQRDGEGEGEIGHAGVGSATPFFAFVADEGGIVAEKGDVALAFGEGFHSAVDGISAAGPRAGGNDATESKKQSTGKVAWHNRPSSPQK